MATVFDSKAQMYVCIRGSGIVGYGDTPQAAETMADAAEVEQRRCAEKKAQPVRRWRLNVKTMRYEIVIGE
jgi:hypothetical protein